MYNIKKKMRAINTKIIVIFKLKIKGLFLQHLRAISNYQANAQFQWLFMDHSFIVCDNSLTHT